MPSREPVSRPSSPLWSIAMLVRSCAHSQADRRARSPAGGTRVASENRERPRSIERGLFTHPQISLHPLPYLAEDRLASATDQTDLRLGGLLGGRGELGV